MKCSNPLYLLLPFSVGLWSRANGTRAQCLALCMAHGRSSRPGHYRGPLGKDKLAFISGSRIQTSPATAGSGSTRDTERQAESAWFPNCSGAEGHRRDKNAEGAPSLLKKAHQWASQQALPRPLSPHVVRREEVGVYSLNANHIP